VTEARWAPRQHHDAVVDDEGGHCRRGHRGCVPRARDAAASGVRRRWGDRVRLLLMVMATSGGRQRCCHAAAGGGGYLLHASHRHCCQHHDEHLHQACWRPCHRGVGCGCWRRPRWRFHPHRRRRPLCGDGDGWCRRGC